MASESFEFRGALIREQDIAFAVVEVELAVLQGGQKLIQEERKKYIPIFKDVPIILAARGPDKRARFLGRSDIVKFLSQAGWSRIPWTRYNARKKDRNPFRDWA